jgi:hypothetical protein
MRHVLGIMFLCALGSENSFAQTDVEMNHFAFGFEMEVETGKGIVELPIPANIYETVVDPLLGDLAVFNLKGEVVPHAFGRTEGQIVENTALPKDLTMFPIYGETNDVGEFRELKVKTSQDGKILELKSGRSKVNAKLLIGYLIDAVQAPGKIAKLKFVLDEQQSNAFLKVSLEGSDDLETWVYVGSTAVLGRFAVNQEVLVKDELTLSGQQKRYYRLSWRNGDADVRLRGVSAVFAPEQEIKKEALRWNAVTGVKVEDPNSGVAYDYDVGGYFPIQGIQVRFEDQNSMATLAVSGSNQQKGPWQAVYTGKFYEFVRNGTTVSNLESEVNEHFFRFWRVQLKSNAAGVGDKFPRISFGWRPRMLRFLARGDGPFILAFGSGFARIRQDLESVDFGLGGEVGSANLSDRRTLGGANQLIYKEPKSLPLKKLILWASLIAGVISLAVMAWQVKKQMNTLT